MSSPTFIDLLKSHYKFESQDSTIGEHIMSLKKKDMKKEN